MTLKMKLPHCRVTSYTNCPVMQHHIPEELRTHFLFCFFIEECSGIHQRMWRNLVALAGPHNQWLPQQVQVTDLW